MGAGEGRYPAAVPATDEIKERIEAEVDRRADVLLDVSRRIHARPELAFAEHTAHDLLTNVLEAEGLAVERGAYDLDTAFVARAGSDGPTVAVCCEYDALPGIGHGCGHNVIAAAGLGAGLAAAAVANELGGRVVVLGTPAEEGGGGKQIMIDRGALDGVDAAMMVHPAGVDLRSMDTLAIHQVEVTYRGRAAHASAAPERGLNALDAAVLGYVNVAALRQHIATDERVHGIFLEAGTAANVVPALTRAHWMVRSPTRAGLTALKERVVACLAAGAEAAGCEIDLDWQDPAYDELLTLDAFDDVWAANLARTGRRAVRAGDDGAAPVVGSTDMGNVSQRVPSIHPMIAVSPPDVPIHTEAFASFAGAEAGDRAVLDAAKALATTVADVWIDDELRDRIRAEFDLRRT